ncbi:MAG: CinA family protein [Gammaproteobacteria bacterium]|nr:CinA family protein [Gammaproteobacteria bacterium]
MEQEKTHDLLMTRLRENNCRVVTAESCTGGWIAKTLTDRPGSSDYCVGGFVTYSNQAKHYMIGVPEQTIADHGAVSPEVVSAMCEGALVHSDATIAIAVSGIAGPGGGSEQKPVGTVWFGCIQREQAIAYVECQQFSGSRDDIRRSTVTRALEILLEQVEGNRE